MVITRGKGRLGEVKEGGEGINCDQRDWTLRSKDTIQYADDEL